MTYPASPAKTSTTGPKILTFGGIGLLVVTAVLAVFVVRLFLSVLPLGIVDSDGSPGPDAVGGTDVPGSVTLTLETDTAYTVYLAFPSNTAAALSEDPTVTDAMGTILPGLPAPASTSTIGGVSAEGVHTFRTSAAGEYTIDVPELADPDSTPWATAVVTEGDDLPAFFSGLFGTVFGVFLAIGLGVLGLGMVVGGGIWWYVRSRVRNAPGMQRPDSPIAAVDRAHSSPGDPS